MENTEKQQKKLSKPIAALTGLSLALGLGWTLSSGLKEEPKGIVTSNNEVHLALPYRGACAGMEVLKGDTKLELLHQDVKGGLANFSFSLPEGEHDLTLRFKNIIPGLEKSYHLAAVIDQEPPSLEAELVNAGAVTIAENTTISGLLETGSTLTLEGEELSVNGDGAFETEFELKPGWNHLLLSAVDTAGNTNNKKLSIFRDTEDPEIDWQTRPDEVFEKKTARVVLDLKDDGKIVGVSGKVDGDQPVQWFAKGNQRWVGTTPELHEGFHEITIKAVDESGRIVAGQRQVIINSSEALGDAVLGLGARGEDVKLLHERLMEAGYLEKSEQIAGVFSQDTEKALKKLQKAEGYDVTGKAEGKALVALGPRIFINLSKFSLVLDRPGKEQRRWMVASGSYAHPTPVGKFIIKEKVSHPTWLPPKSDWAKDAKPIPPGPGNPLGTRWLGFDWGGVGIHGTNAPWSIGTASSHGCLRMVTGQVEELYELVEVGTPVVVLGGWEENPAVGRYWPKKKPKPAEEVAKAKEKAKETAEATPAAEESKPETAAEDTKPETAADEAKPNTASTGDEAKKMANR